jgi:hypothetical protein
LGKHGKFDEKDRGGLWYPELKGMDMAHRDSNRAHYLIKSTTSRVTLANRWDHFLARWGIRRNQHLVEPGLYALGNPTADSPVFVTANYTLSFDALRSALGGIDGYIMVLDTKGINVWCAAGKGTFGTDELVNRIELTGLHNVVNHRVLILPQLGATGVGGHEVKRRSGFMVEYGPVRAKDLPEYLKSHRATPEMRQVRFNLNDRLVLIPVELVHVLLPMAVAAVLLFFVGGLFASATAVAAILSGVVLFPIFLPWLPTSDFSVKGFILGGLVALPFALRIYSGTATPEWWLRGAWALIFLLAMPPVTSYLALNFTGSTPFTSKSGVRHEIFAYIPVMAVMFGTGIVLAIALILIRAWGGA